MVIGTRKGIRTDMEPQKSVSAATQLVNSMMGDLMESKNVFIGMGAANAQLKQEVSKLRDLVDSQQEQIISLGRDNAIQAEKHRAEISTKVKASEQELRRAASKYRAAAEQTQSKLQQLNASGNGSLQEQLQASDQRAKHAETKIFQLNMEVGDLRRENDSQRRRLEDNATYISSLENANEELQSKVAELQAKVALR